MTEYNVGYFLILLLVVVLYVGVDQINQMETIHTVKHQTLEFQVRGKDFPFAFTHQERRFKVEQNGDVWIQEGTAEVK